MSTEWWVRKKFINLCRVGLRTGREEIVRFLMRKWTEELDYRLIKELWAFDSDRIAVRFAYEFHDGQAKVPGCHVDVVPALRPAEEPIRLGDPHIIDAGIPMMHDAVGIKLPVFVAIGAIPLTRIVTVLVGKPHRNAISVKCPEFFDEAILKLSLPLAREELHNLILACHEFRPVAPFAIRRISEGNLLGIARIPAIAVETLLINRWANNA